MAEYARPQSPLFNTYHSNPANWVDGSDTTSNTDTESEFDSDDECSNQLTTLVATRRNWADDDDDDFDLEAWKATADTSAPIFDAPLTMPTRFTFDEKSARPSTPRNWADDDEDDFDLDAWKATADTSAPTIDSLPPMQEEPAAEECTFVVSHDVTTTKSTPSLVEPPQESEPVEQEGENSGYLTAGQVLAHRATRDVSGKPAYPEMSITHENMISSSERINYNKAWKNMKVNAGCDCRYVVQWRRSPLSQVTSVNDEDVADGCEGHALEFRNEAEEGFLEDTMMFKRNEEPLSVELAAQEQYIPVTEEEFESQEEVADGLELTADVEDEERSSIALEDSNIEHYTIAAVEPCNTLIGHTAEQDNEAEDVLSCQSTTSEDANTESPGETDSCDDTDSSGDTDHTEYGDSVPEFISANYDKCIDYSNPQVTRDAPRTTKETVMPATSLITTTSKSSYTPSTTLDVPHNTRISNQGYYCNQRTPTLSTPSSSKVNTDIPVYTTRPGLYPSRTLHDIGSYIRNKSRETPKSAHTAIDKDGEVDNDNDGPLEAVSLTLAPVSPKQKNTPFRNAAKSGWAYISGVSMKVVTVIVATGMLLGGARCVTRRRRSP
ncbi:hypothetical protein GQ44DRAFT_778108 [Phaeosphaeriaceae sp. PMI808]|nr:hypothetical protein GQ44DRAFT_778108 [Phaeosphaeriaceae sp. PMI808]